MTKGIFTRQVVVNWSRSSQVGMASRRQLEPCIPGRYAKSSSIGAVHPRSGQVGRARHVRVSSDSFSVVLQCSAFSSLRLAARIASSSSLLALRPHPRIPNKRLLLNPIDSVLALRRHRLSWHCVLFVAFPTGICCSTPLTLSGLLGSTP